MALQARILVKVMVYKSKELSCLCIGILHISEQLIAPIGYTFYLIQMYKHNISK